MVRTDCFLACLVFAATQSIPNKKDRDIAIDARTRAVACISAVCEPKENRATVLMYPGLVECLVSVIDIDKGEARALACGACALIAKSVECREAIMEEERLVIVLAQVLGGQQESRPQASSMTPIGDTARGGRSSGGGGGGKKKKGKRTPTKSTLQQPEGTNDEKKSDKQRHPDVGHTKDLSRLSDSTHSGSEDNDSAYDRQPNSFEDDEDDDDNDDDDDDDEDDDDDDEEDYSIVSHSYDETGADTDDHGGEDGGPETGGNNVRGGGGGGGVNTSLRRIGQEKSLEYYERARSNSCAVFLHLSKHCPTAVRSFFSMFFCCAICVPYISLNCNLFVSSHSIAIFLFCVGVAFLPHLLLSSMYK